MRFIMYVLLGFALITLGILNVDAAQDRLAYDNNLMLFHLRLWFSLFLMLGGIAAIYAADRQ